MKMNKGFTLIELLAVIVILGVILLIVVPSAINTVDNASKNTFATSAKKLIDIAKIYVTDNNIELPDQTKYISIAITNLDFENSEAYGTDGGVLIVNYGTALDPDYDYFVYLSNDDYLVNGANKANIRDNVNNIGTSIPYIAVVLPTVASVYINSTLGITNDVKNETSGYTQFTHHG